MKGEKRLVNMQPGGFQGPRRRQRGPGFPPGGGFPGPGTPGFPPGGFPGQPPGPQGPSSPPPQFTPAYPSQQLFAVDPGAISGCLHRFTYVWLSRREGFWFFPVFVGPRSVAGFRWSNSRRRWQYIGLDLNRIDAFSCYF